MGSQTLPVVCVNCVYSFKAITYWCESKEAHNKEYSNHPMDIIETKNNTCVYKKALSKPYFIYRTVYNLQQDILSLLERINNE